MINVSEVEITREAIEALADQEGVAPLALVSLLQAGAAKLEDGEATLEKLCAIKAEMLEGR